MAQSPRLFNAQYMTRMARIALMPPKAMWNYPGFVESCGLGISIAVGVSSCPPASWHSLVLELTRFGGRLVT
jgi:hypothetical protein